MGECLVHPLMYTYYIYSPIIRKITTLSARLFPHFEPKKRFLKKVRCKIAFWAQAKNADRT